jgi:predicted nucleotidyltransferase
VSIGLLRLPKLGIIMLKMGIKQRSPNGLAGALFSKVQLSVLGLLIGQPDRSFRISEIIRLVGSGSGAVQRELETLTAAGIFTVSSSGNQKLYRANRQSPIFEELYGIVLKTVGLLEPLKKALKPYQSKIVFAFVYGSIAKGTDIAKSDIDLMIIGEQITYGDIFMALQNAEKTLQRPINPNLMTVDDWRKRRASKSAFVTKIAEQPKMFVVGTDHELQGIG